SALDSALHVGDLAAKNLEPLRLCEDRRDAILLRGARLANGATDALGVREAAVHRRLADLATSDWRANSGCDGSEVDRERAAETLQPEVVAGLQDHVVATLVGERHRTQADTVQSQRNKLPLRKSASHAIRVDDRFSQTGAQRQRDHGVPAADLYRHHRRDRIGQEAAEAVVRVGQLFAQRELLDQWHRRANHERNSDVIGVGQIADVYQLWRPVMLQAADGWQLAQIHSCYPS